MATLVEYLLEYNVKSHFLRVGPLVPMRTNWLQTKFSVLNFGKQSLNISLLCNNCLSDRFNSDQNLSLADMKACCLSFKKGPLKGHRRSYRLQQCKSVCSRKRKTFFFRFLLEMSESSPKKLFKIARCFRSHLVSLFENFHKVTEICRIMVTIQNRIMLNTFSTQATKTI